MSEVEKARTKRTQDLNKLPQMGWQAQVYGQNSRAPNYAVQWSANSEG